MFVNSILIFMILSCWDYFKDIFVRTFLESCTIFHNKNILQLTQPPLSVCSMPTDHISLPLALSLARSHVLTFHLPIVIITDIMHPE